MPETVKLKLEISNCYECPYCTFRSTPDNVIILGCKWKGILNERIYTKPLV